MSKSIRINICNRILNDVNQALEYLGDVDMLEFRNDRYVLWKNLPDYQELTVRDPHWSMCRTWTWDKDGRNQTDSGWFKLDD